MDRQYVLGIDLGTTNSVLACARVASESPQVELVALPQLTSPGTVEDRWLLPSFLHLAGGMQAQVGAFDLPWRRGMDYAVGELAQRLAAEMPMRTVAAAKSWLAESRVDRRQPILPFQAPSDVPKVSPVVASQRYLEHLVAAWNHAFPDAPAAQQQVVLAVPASFDPSARELTREAALAAGLPEDLVLLEEPQAAVYAWLADVGDRWRRELQLGDTVLVCDVGGGTSDFTLIRVAEEAGALSLSRVAVGNHLLVGGDNMDLALAHHAATGFADKGLSLDAWQSVSLWHACRAAKEALFSPKAPARHKLSILGRGTKLIGKTVSIELDRDEARTLVLDGFLPRCRLDDRPVRRPAAGFRELGLAYESDAAITRHLAAFLSAQADEPAGSVRPTHVLFNGGVFKSVVLQERLFEVLASWFDDSPPPARLAGNRDLDFAVAKGAAAYGAVKEGRGVRIRAPAPRSYYIGIETAGPAIPGKARPLRALCVVPFGMEEGTSLEVPGEPIGLVVGESAPFRFYSSACRKQDRPGDILASFSEDELQETAPLVATLPAEDPARGSYVPVRFESRLTELGMFELWSAATTSSDRWKLEFSVRDNPD